MKILVISDVHANSWALRAAIQDAGPVDHVLCAGDTVSYGPDPRATLDLLRECGVIAARGNHDHAVASGADPRASPAKQPLALAMRDWTRSRLELADVAWLARWPLRLLWEVGGTRFAVVHATPRDPLYDYRLRPDAPDDLVREVAAGIDADVLVVGHTHWPLLRTHGPLQIVNPGSVGQPLDGDPRAAYAIWEDGEVRLRRTPYPVERTVRQLEALSLPPAITQRLAAILRTGEAQ